MANTVARSGDPSHDKKKHSKRGRIRQVALDEQRRPRFDPHMTVTAVAGLVDVKTGYYYYYYYYYYHYDYYYYYHYDYYYYY